MVLDIVAIDDDRLPCAIRSREAYLVENAFEYGVKAASTDVLDCGIDLHCDSGERRNALIAELELDPLCFEQCRVLFYQTRLRFRQDAPEILLAQSLELDPNGQPALQLR